MDQFATNAPTGTAADRPDHVAVECEFMAQLIEFQRQALQRLRRFFDLTPYRSHHSRTACWVHRCEERAKSARLLLP
jgi:hypothetical protein